MARKSDGILGDLWDLAADGPWWVGVFLALCLFVVFRFILPSVDFGNAAVKALTQVGKAFSFLSFAFLVPAGISAVRSFNKRRLLDSQSGINSICALSWREFEQLLGEAYRRRGYRVLENTFSGADGGVDLRIEKDGNSYLVQCKQWKAFKVPVGVVREMFGLMVAEKSSGVIIVTSGMFTQEARTFAEGKPIDLIEGRQLADIIRSVQTGPAAPTPSPRPPTVERPPGPPGMRCPRCGGELVLRKARRGYHAGKDFWGCKGYPACKYIRNAEE